LESETKPKVLVVYFTLTQQSGRVAEVMAQALEARGCDVTKALIEFTDERWAPQLSRFPVTHPIPQIASVLPAQIHHKTGEIRIPPEAQTGDYDLIVLASPTWWFPNEYANPLVSRVTRGEGGLERQAVRVRVHLPPLLQHQPRTTKEARRKERRADVAKTHFVVAGGQVEFMLSWLGYMKHGEPQERVMGLTMPPPNLKPDFEEQARSFIDDVVDQTSSKSVSGAA
jgi:hypothetical protein